LYIKALLLPPSPPLPPHTELPPFKIQRSYKSLEEKSTLLFCKMPEIKKVKLHWGRNPLFQCSLAFQAQFWAITLDQALHIIQEDPTRDSLPYTSYTHFGSCYSGFGFVMDMSPESQAQNLPNI